MVHNILVEALALIIVVLSACGDSGNGQEGNESHLDGVRLIDELIACDPPGTWDKPGMLQTLEEREDEYTEFLQEMLEDCYLSGTIFATYTPPPT